MWRTLLFRTECRSKCSPGHDVSLSRGSARDYSTTSGVVMFRTLLIQLDGGVSSHSAFSSPSQRLIGPQSPITTALPSREIA